MTIVHAPGIIDVFDTSLVFDSGGPMRTNRYVGDVNYGWQPSPKSGGLVLSPMQFGPVFAKRPIDITMRPDGNRALVAFTQTGNFGVLDHEGQKFFNNLEARTLGGAAGFLSGVVAVTPSVSLDKHLWPDRGASSVGGFFIPSP